MCEHQEKPPNSNNKGRLFLVLLPLLLGLPRQARIKPFKGRLPKTSRPLFPRQILPWQQPQQQVRNL